MCPVCPAVEVSARALRRLMLLSNFKNYWIMVDIPRYVTPGISLPNNRTPIPHLLPQLRDLLPVVPQIVPPAAPQPAPPRPGAGPHAALRQPRTGLRKKYGTAYATRSHVCRHCNTVSSPFAHAGYSESAPHCRVLQLPRSAHEAKAPYHHRCVGACLCPVPRIVTTTWTSSHTPPTCSNRPTCSSNR